MFDIIMKRRDIVISVAVLIAVTAIYFAVSQGITTNCDDIACNFNNTSSENVSTCGYIVLTPKKGVLNSSSSISSDHPLLEIAKGYLSVALNSGTDEELSKNKDFLEASTKSMTNEKIAFSSSEICSGVVKSSSNIQIKHNSGFGFGHKSVSDLCNGTGGCNIDFVQKEKLVSLIRINAQ